MLIEVFQESGRRSGSRFLEKMNRTKMCVFVDIYGASVDGENRGLREMTLQDRLVRVPVLYGSREASLSDWD